MTKTAKTDQVYKYLTAALCCVAFLFLFIIAIVLVKYSYPSFVVWGIKFFTTTAWSPDLNAPIISVHGIQITQGSTYGFLVFLFGTLATSGMAILFGVPASLAIAIFLTQIAPKRIVAPISFLVELLAGVPSVVLGFWGLLVLGPTLLKTVEPVMSRYLGWIPFLGGHVYSYGFLGSGLILALMIVPIVASISRDVMSQTPIELKEGAKALGLTNWEVTKKIVLPYSKVGIFGGVILGLGRALGETMAVAMVSGFGRFLPSNLYSAINTMAAEMALSLDGAFTDPTGMYVSALVELAVLLLLITMVVNVVARFLVRQGVASRGEAIRGV